MNRRNEERQHEERIAAGFVILYTLQLLPIEPKLKTRHWG